MRKGVLALVCVLAIAAAAYLTYAQAEHQVQDMGYIDIGSYKDTPANPRPNGSIYRGDGVSTYRGKPPKPFLQSDAGGYELDTAPAADRNKPYDHHDFSHVWSFIGESAPVMGKPPPMTEAAKTSRASHVTTDDVYRAHKPSNDPELTCNPMGYPRILYRDRAYEFFQLPKVTLYHHVWHDTWVKIWTDGRPLPKGNLDPAVVGYNVGKWVGDTFVQDTDGVDPRVWLSGGLGQSADAEFQTRWRRIDHNTLQMNLTIRDPKFYLGGDWNTPPQTSELYPDLELDILPCIPADEFEYRDNSATENPTPGTTTTPEE